MRMRVVLIDYLNVVVRVFQRGSSFIIWALWADADAGYHRVNSIMVK